MAILVIALTYCGYNYFSGDFGSLGFILRLTNNSTARLWPALRVCYVLQILVAVGAASFFWKPLVLRVLALASISLSAFIQSVQVAACLSLELDPAVKVTGAALPVSIVIATALYGCLAWALISTWKAKPAQNMSEPEVTSEPASIT